MKKINYAAMFTLRKDGRYQGYWRDEKGKRHALCDRDAERLYNRIKEKEEPHPTLFSEVASAWESAHRERVTERTWKNYAPHLSDMVDRYGGMGIEEITAQLVSEDLRSAKAIGYSATIVKTRKAIFTQALDHAVAEGILPYNPALSVRLPRGLPKGKRRAPTDDEIKTILSSVDAPFGFFPFLLLCTGMRKSEALALLKKDVDLKAGVISVTKALTYIDSTNPTVKEPKSEMGARTIPIVDILKEPLKRQMQHKEPELFPAVPSKRYPREGYMSEPSYETAWNNYCKAVGFLDEEGNPSVTAHILRHGTATLLFESGVDVYTAQRLLGHAQISTTMGIYTELREKQKQKSVSAFNDGMASLMANKK